MILGETCVIPQGTDGTTGDGVVERRVLPITTQTALRLLLNQLSALSLTRSSGKGCG